MGKSSAKNSKSSNLPQALSKLSKRQKAGLSVCVGLDPDLNLLPDSLKSRTDSGRAIYAFNKRIIDSTAAYACAFKPNSAFYEGAGENGFSALESTFIYMREQHPEILRILDAKRADIGNTNIGYARMAFDVLDADALTVAPYMGGSMLDGSVSKLASLAPFLSQKNKLIFVLCRTSNEDAGEFQDLPVSIKDLPVDYGRKFGKLTGLADIIEKEGIADELAQKGYARGTVPLYLVVAYKLSKDWNINGNLGLVVGATYPAELGWIRKIVGDMPILAPGLGFQGGETKLAIQNGLDSAGRGLIVNSSRGIIFSGHGKADYDRNFAKEAGLAVKKLHEEIAGYL